MTTHPARGADDQVHAVADLPDPPPRATTPLALCGRAAALPCAAHVVTTCAACATGADGPQVSFAHEPCG